MFTPGTKIKFVYTRQTSKSGGTEGERKFRAGTVTADVALNKKTGDPFIMVDCGDTYNGEPMSKAFRLAGITNVTVIS